MARGSAGQRALPALNSIQYSAQLLSAVRFCRVKVNNRAWVVRYGHTCDVLMTYEQNPLRSAIDDTRHVSDEPTSAGSGFRPQMSARR